jgi:DNA invertase Pin-like site-specific DNA recombinase
MVVYYGILPPFEKGTPVRHSDDRAAVERYARDNNGHIIEHYWEEGRTRRSTRPKLVEALRHVKNASALLIIPRFEPVARDAVFLKLLWESGVNFTACDNGHASQTTLPLLASIVARETRWIADRTKAALQKRKRRHGSLGTPHNLTLEARLRGAESTKSLHRTSLNDEMQAQLLRLRAEGKSLRQIAAILSDQGHRTKTGRPWSHTLVKRLLDRCEELERNRAVYRAKRLEASDAK